MVFINFAVLDKLYSYTSDFWECSGKASTGLCGSNPTEIIQKRRTERPGSMWVRLGETAGVSTVTGDGDIFALERALLRTPGA